MAMKYKFPGSSKSLVKKYLTRDLIEILQHQSTSTGFTLEKAIRSGIENHDSSIGIYAGDAQSYQTFSLVFKPIIHEYHGVTSGTKHPLDINRLDLADPDPDNKFILSTRIRVARNLKGFRFTNHIDLDSRKILEKKIISALNNLQADLKGEYHSFELPDTSEELDLRNETLQFGKGDRFQDAAGINTDFPKCRGIFYSADQRFRVWVNEEDHMRIICQDESSDISGVFNHLCKALKLLEQTLEFEKDDTYGYLSSCPTNIGTAMRAGVHIQLKKLGQNRSFLSSITKKHGLQIRGTLGEKTRIDNAVFDISNHQRLGISAAEIIKNLHKGLLVIIDAEKSL